MSFKALIVDDDQSFRRLLELRLRTCAADLEVVTASSLADARQAITQRNKDSRITKGSYFDLVVLDQHLPDGSGLELLREGFLEGAAVLAVSSDEAPEIPGASIGAGATYFLSKMNISQPLFKPLIQGIMDRAQLIHEINEAENQKIVIETVKTLVATLRHEINNPLGAVLGAAYLLNTDANANEEQREAARLVESSGKRIKHVLDELCAAISLEPITKAHHKVFHIPGDKPWES